MIPVSITIKGLYSYQYETNIDFRPLTAAGLFGIFGAVGSGKSSILEAITFALYGETDRLNIKEARGYNMMNLKSNELFIDFVFYTGSPEKKYRFTVKSKRNKKRFSETTPFERSAYELIDENWQPTNKTADEILGLSYRNFKRTVIIPQGKFQEFLQLKDSERVQMLKEIFNLEKYELGPAVATLTKQNDLQISNLEGQLIGVPQIEEQAVEIIQQKITHTEQTLIKETTALKKIQDTEKALETLKNLFVSLQTKKEKWQGLKDNEGNYLQLEKDISNYENCERAFKNLLLNKQQVETLVKAIHADLDLNNKEHHRLQQEILQCETNHNSLKDKYNTKDKLLQQADELAKIIIIGQLQTKTEELNQRIRKGKVLFENQETNLTNEKGVMQQLQQTILEHESQLPDTHTLVQVSNWFAQFEQYKTELQQLMTDESAVQYDVNQLKQSIADYIKQLPLQLNNEQLPKTFSELKKHFEKYIEEKNEGIAAVKKEIAHLQLTEKLEEFVQQIKDGVPCPLCGSEHHPNILSVEDVSERMFHLQEKVKQAQGEFEKLQESLLHLSSLYAQYNALNITEVNVQKKIQQQYEILKKFEQSFSFLSYNINDYKKVTQELSLLEQKNNTITGLRQQFTAAQNNYEQIQKTISDYQKGIEKLQLELARLNGESETLQSQITLYDNDRWIQFSEKQLNEELTHCKNSYNNIVTEFEKNQIALQQLHAQQNIIKGKLDEIKKQQKLQEVESQKLLATLNESLKKFGFETEDEVKNILAKSINVNVEKGRLKSFQNELYAATIHLHEAESLTLGKTYETETHKSLLEELQVKTEIIQKYNEELFALKQDAEVLKQNVIKRKALQQELDVLTNRATDLKVLYNLFRSAGFVNYVSGVYLHNLINAANSRFHKMTNQNLSLELTEDNSFLVRDYLNNGETRSVKTLSGGQTFQAALSLALALADNIQQLSKSAENFFFLDEGFGTLDKESLHIAFNTLKGLKKENRIVGLISHVEEMQQEVEIYLQVKNSADSGSIVKGNWTI